MAEGELDAGGGPTSNLIYSSSNAAVTGYRYVPPPPRKFTIREAGMRLNDINRQKHADYLLEHPLGSIIEYPASGPVHGQTVLHRFAVDANHFFNPKDNIQFSLGDSHCVRQNVKCGKFLVDKDGSPVACTELYTKCKGLKFCEMDSPAPSAMIPGLSPTIDLPGEEVFSKTLAFYCALEEQGCAFRAETDSNSESSSILADHIEHSEDSDSLSDNELEPVYTRGKTKDAAHCKGKMQLCYDQYGRPIIQCEFRSKKRQAHLILSNLDEFHLLYLKSLLEGDSLAAFQYEHDASMKGYGPLLACTFSAAPSTQKQLCPNFHRFSNGQLRRGTLSRASNPCETVFSVYTPCNLLECPYVVILSRNPHSHPNPFPIKTPPPLLELFNSLLKDLGWKLADATPRKILIDSGFAQSLRKAITWNKEHDPALSDLHPSLGNSDHVRRLIHIMQLKFYPDGTGFEGAVRLAEQHKSLLNEQKYVRCAEKHTLKDGKTFYLVICMSPAMSHWLMGSKYLTIDTSFKRIQGWQEFEMESWDSKHMRSVVGVRALTTSQSAEAHFILFTRIFHFTEVDTKLPPRFLHIHGEGFHVWIADAHKGQALGAGMYCQSLCKSSDMICPREHGRRLRELDPYDHLKRFFRLCVIHFKRKITEMKTQITHEVRQAMLSISSSRKHPDLEEAFKTIENGGKKAKAWLKDKRVTNKFALPALYQPLSLIPLDVWQAAPKDTNGNEQGHENVARDGMGLTVVGAINRGMNYDFRAMESLALRESQGINIRDELSTHFERAKRSVSRTTRVQHKIQAQKRPTPERNFVSNEPGTISIPVQLELSPNPCHIEDRWMTPPEYETYNTDLPSHIEIDDPMPEACSPGIVTLDRVSEGKVGWGVLDNHVAADGGPVTFEVGHGSRGTGDEQDPVEGKGCSQVLDGQNLITGWNSNDGQPSHIQENELWESIHEEVPKHLLSTYSSLDGALGYSMRGQFR